MMIRLFKLLDSELILGVITRLEILQSEHPRPMPSRKALTEIRFQLFLSRVSIEWRPIPNASVHSSGSDHSNRFDQLPSFRNSLLKTLYRKIQALQNETSLIKSAILIPTNFSAR